MIFFFFLKFLIKKKNEKRIGRKNFFFLEINEKIMETIFFKFHIYYKSKLNFGEFTFQKEYFFLAINKNKYHFKIPFYFIRIKKRNLIFY